MINQLPVFTAFKVVQFFRRSTLSSLIKFKCKIVLNLIVSWKDKIVCVSLVNVTMCLNIVRELYPSFKFCSWVNC